MLTLLRGKDLIKDELNKARREGYSKDYENLICKYFEVLQGGRLEIEWAYNVLAMSGCLV